jgi:hypothetical protein
MKCATPHRSARRVRIAPERLDRYLTRKLHELPGFEAVSVSAGYRLRATDENGCNWSGDVVPMYGIRAPLATDIAAALRPIVKAAQRRFNLSD